ncbi:radical SAM/SPASM domain-containing protein [Marinifilum caeruleilacunae]|uniref:Radical SAM protein n=1 Tax=Marinifilum caeruleilacunae TaxID=2499076 RepID=A0ABX1X226_9BACT|nr:radical SAM protein [Marinifilum caeruleilacunae]NOU62301.1 radical SAM protein [Marinifilum caeruleilacunae]
MDKLNWSRYNFLWNSEKYGKLLYNSYTNGFLELNDSLYQELNDISKNSNKQYLKTLSKEEQQYLKDHFILVENDDFLVERMHHESMSRIYDKKHLVLTIAPTQYCNFNCTYCYENWRTKGSMSDETEEALIRYLEQQKRHNGLESLSLTWYGGEPLIEYNRIKSLGQKIKKLGFHIHENEIVTNGYLFDEKRIQILTDVGINQIQITIDGFKSVHDKTRPLLNGQGTFDKIIQNLDRFYAGSHNNVISIALRVNIDKSNKSSYLDIYNWLSKRYPFETFVVYPGWIHLDENNEKKCDCFTRNEATDFCFELCKNHGIISEKLYPDDINMECMARNPNSMIVGWQGEIYKCFEDLGNENLIVGSLHNEDIWTNHMLISKYAMGIDHYQDTVCRKCSYLPICYGGCPIRRLENKYEGKLNDCCTPFKGRLEEFLELLYESKRER